MFLEKFIDMKNIKKLFNQIEEKIKPLEKVIEDIINEKLSFEVNQISQKVFLLNNYIQKKELEKKLKQYNYCYNANIKNCNKINFITLTAIKNGINSTITLDMYFDYSEKRFKSDIKNYFKESQNSYFAYETDKNKRKQKLYIEVFNNKQRSIILYIDKLGNVSINPVHPEIQKHFIKLDSSIKSKIPIQTCQKIYMKLNDSNNTSIDYISEFFKQVEVTFLTEKNINNKKQLEEAILYENIMNDSSLLKSLIEEFDLEGCIDIERFNPITPKTSHIKNWIQKFIKQHE